VSPSGRCVALLVAVSLAAGCRSSPPKRFYVLDPVPPQARMQAMSADAVQVATVNIPPSLDRQEMVRESAADRLEVSDINRWGAPLADMTQDVLTQDLMQRLPEGKVLPPHNAAPATAYEITVDILQFGRDASGKVLLGGGWSLYRLGSDTPILNRTVTLSENAATDDYAGQAHTMSLILGRLADDIATTLQTLRARAAALSCPTVEPATAASSERMIEKKVNHADTLGSVPAGCAVP